MAQVRTGIVAVGALMLGILIGSFSTKARDSQLEAELEQARAQLKEARRVSPFAEAVRALGTRGLELPRPLPQQQAVAAELPVTTPAAVDDSSLASPSPESVGLRLRSSTPGSKERAEALEAMKSTWKLRAAQARAAFEEQADISEDQARALDAVVSQMNQQVKAVLDGALEQVDFSKRPQSRDVVSLGIELGEVYLDIDSEVRQVLSPEQLEAARSSDFDIFSQLDPETLEPMLNRLDTAEASDSHEE